MKIDITANDYAALFYICLNPARNYGLINVLTPAVKPIGEALLRPENAEPSILEIAEKIRAKNIRKS